MRRNTGTGLNNLPGIYKKKPGVGEAPLTLKGRGGRGGGGVAHVACMCNPVQGNMVWIKVSVCHHQESKLKGSLGSEYGYDVLF